ncbi:sigma-70 family RNA polymerase sigma factor [Aeoliella mucimassa]|uniref:RNA polymerase sigma factor SigA n=1 Tax=Aeoliella mucimassa TaxID=2527972 RepID=A0A518AJM1_9BACT|nr:sigma-70 family RNA polymerase sigma factor [Aeoliella mucimassa]QDU54933.1 RNA polymerase sigma factor SigA [Aeoliella mucimassa]
MTTKGRTKSTANKSRNNELRQRAESLADLNISFIASERFADAEATPEDEQLAAIELGHETTHAKGGEGLPPHLRRMCATPLLTAEMEQQVFFRMNYCKYHAAAVLGTLHPSRPARGKVEEAEEYLERADRLRNYLIQANTRLVMSIARKYADPRNPFDDLLSRGIASLIRAVEKFDCDRGYRFSTYATCAVRRDLNRLVMNSRRDSQRFAPTPGDVLESVVEEDFEHPGKAVDRWKSLSELLSQMMEVLDDREKQIIRARFGFDEDSKISFSHLGKRMGISKERARQLANRALDKLREQDDANVLAGFC